MSKKKEIWEQITKNLESKLPKSDFNTWFSQTTLRKLNPDLAIIGVPNKFYANWLRDRYGRQIKKSFETVVAQSPEVHFTCDRPSKIQDAPDLEPPQKRDKYLKHDLDSSMTFGRFFVGDSNRFACSSALEVANRPARQYNPLYIFSKGALGKTHLLNAIGNHVLSKDPFSRIGYLSSNRFTSDFTYSIKNQKVHEFRERYSALDLLLLDDVQFLDRRIRTQEEFLFIFDALYGAKKQIVVAGDRAPNQLSKTGSQLKSRLGCGLIAEIEAPDQSTKIDIIKKRAKEESITIPDDVIFFLAKWSKDIKGLIENIIRVETYASLNHRDINISTVKSFIQDKNRKEIGIEDVKSITAAYFNISLAEVISNKKQRVYSYPRQIAMYLCRKYTDLSFKEIGDSFGSKDHSTVIYAVKRIEKYKGQKKEIRDDLNKIKNLLG